MLVPTVIIGAVIGTAWYKAKPKTQAPPDPMVAHVFAMALNQRLSPDGYRKLSAFMDKWGYLEEARVLKARASYGDLPSAVHAQHHQIVTSALKSNDPALVRKIGDNLYSQGAIANGIRLRKHAAAMEAAAKVAPVEPPAPPPPPPPPAEEAGPLPASPEQEDTPSPGESAEAAE